jgi:hypothetical protein
MSSRFDFVYGDGGGMPADVPNSTGQQISADGLGLKIYGNMGPIDAARFQNSFVLYFTGSYANPIHAGDFFTADLDFDVIVTGGEVAWSFYSEMWSFEGFEYARAVGSGQVPANGHVGPVHMDNDHFTQTALEGGAYIQGFLNLQWTNASPTDALTLNVPQNSIDIAMNIPEPVGISLLLLMPMLDLRRRRSA